MADNGGTRVALVGARGIGKHHGKWWALAGAQVCAFVGTSEASVAKTRNALVDLFGFSGRGYTGIEAMLEAETPEIVDVCSPAPCHAQHVRAALEAGCHVLCEKPFVYDPALRRESLMTQARDLAALSEEKGLRLGVCTQYSVAGTLFGRIWDETHPGEPVTVCHGHLESPSKGRPPDPERIWVDLSPHLISVLLKLAPDGEVQWDTLQLRFEGYEALADFTVRRASGPPLKVALVTRNALEPPFNVRHFKYNGYPLNVEGENDAQGVYCARIETPDKCYREPDMMHALIREFLEGRVTADLEECLKNLDIMLRIRDSAKGI